jgi:hypothetical protein
MSTASLSPSEAIAGKAPLHEDRRQQQPRHAEAQPYDVPRVQAGRDGQPRDNAPASPDRYCSEAEYGAFQIGRNGRLHPPTPTRYWETGGWRERAASARFDLTAWLKMKSVFATGYRRPRESGGPGPMAAAFRALDSRFRGNDD